MPAPRWPRWTPPPWRCWTRASPRRALHHRCGWTAPRRAFGGDAPAGRHGRAERRRPPPGMPPAAGTRMGGGDTADQVRGDGHGNDSSGSGISSVPGEESSESAAAGGARATCKRTPTPRCSATSATCLPSQEGAWTTPNAQAERRPRRGGRGRRRGQAHDRQRRPPGACKVFDPDDGGPRSSASRGDEAPRRRPGRGSAARRRQ